MVPIGAVGFISGHGLPLIIDFDLTIHGAGARHAPEWHSTQKSAKPEEMPQSPIGQGRVSLLERCDYSGWCAAGLSMSRLYRSHIR